MALLEHKCPASVETLHLYRKEYEQLEWQDFARNGVLQVAQHLRADMQNDKLDLLRLAAKFCLISFVGRCVIFFGGGFWRIFEHQKIGSFRKLRM